MIQEHLKELSALILKINADNPDLRQDLYEKISVIKEEITEIEKNLEEKTKALDSVFSSAINLVNEIEKLRKKK